MPEPTMSLAAVFSAGVGIFLVGVVNLVAGRAAGVRAVGTALAVVATPALAWAVAGEGVAAAEAAAAIAAGLVPLLAGSARLARRPAARWGGFAAAGVVVAVGSVAVYERRERAAFEWSAAEAGVPESPPARAPAPVRAVTDHGSAVEVSEATDPRPPARLQAYEDTVLRGGRFEGRVIREHPPDDHANCHGWVFTGGRYWVGGAEVDRILAENDYRPVTGPAPGDLAVYRANGAVAHTAVVRYVAPGRPVMVEGKWGCAGVFLHAAEDSIYGTAFAFYHSPRPGHLLAGLAGLAGPSPDGPPADHLARVR